MATVCQMCGVMGWEVALIYCHQCRLHAMHRYCLSVQPETFEEYVVWLCVDCEPKDEKKSTTNHLCQSPGIECEPKNLGKKRKSCKSLKKKSKNRKLKCNSLPPLESLSDHDEFQRENQVYDVSNMQTCENKSTQLSSGDPQVNEANIQNNDEKSCPIASNHGQVIVANDHNSHAGFSMEAVPLKSENNAIILHEPSEREDCAVHEEKDNKLGTIEAIKESISNKEADSHKCMNSQLVVCDVPPLNVIKPSITVLAQPIKDPVWRGSMRISTTDVSTVGGLVAHLSSIACPRVNKEAKALPRLLLLESLPRTTIWPKGFSNLGPSHDSIALYFFPETQRDEIAFDSLVSSMIVEDLAMRAVVENAELLIFTSTILPVDYWRFQSRFFLWGVFKGKRRCSLGNTSLI